VYGRQPREGKLTEDAPMHPSNPYAVSKMAADQLALMYAAQHDMAVMSARPQNHLGPGQSRDFVASAFAGQLAAIAAGDAEPVMRVGNLDSRRDFLDVRDVAAGYRLLLERGRPGRAYNLASGKMVSIRDMLNRMCEIVGVHPRVEIDEARWRPADDPPLLDTSRIEEEVGWHPDIPLTDSLRDLIASLG
jgi:GDP-4-dehydro-6-deoxy-D-mannose reductase